MEAYLARKMASESLVELIIGFNMLYYPCSKTPGLLRAVWRYFAVQLSDSQFEKWAELWDLIVIITVETKRSIHVTCKTYSGGFSLAQSGPLRSLHFDLRVNYKNRGSIAWSIRCPVLRCGPKDVTLSLQEFGAWHIRNKVISAENTSFITISECAAHFYQCRWCWQRTMYSITACINCCGWRRSILK